MNFLGHAFVATQRRTDPGFVLGAMLPDFATMSRNRIRSVAPGSLAEGVAFHHLTDAVFHRTAAFVDLDRHALHALDAAGVRRGPAMAAAHIGTELLLDGWLLQEGHDTTPYVDALPAAEEHLLALTFRDPVGAERLHTLLGRLRSYGLRGYDGPEVITDRIARAVSQRPRLAVRDDERGAMTQVLDAHAERVAERAAELMRDLKAGIADADRRANQAQSQGKLPSRDESYS